MAMKSNANEAANPARDMPADRAARDIVRSALKGALATLDRATGHPYASLVTVATGVDGTPLLLISRLALHTQNLAADPRASLLVETGDMATDPLAAGRVTVIGRAEVTPDPQARSRFLARQPAAEMYAGFADFAFWRLVPERAHFVGGFGRIVPLEAPAILTDVSDARGLIEAEPEIVAHMNADHAAAVELYATALAGAPAGPWRVTGVDPEGCDLVCDGEARRIPFAVRVTSPALARQELTRLAAKARGGHHT
jgi:hypothetical protein